MCIKTVMFEFVGVNNGVTMKWDSGQCIHQPQNPTRVTGVGVAKQWWVEENNRKKGRKTILQTCITNLTIRFQYPDSADQSIHGE